MGQEKLTFYRYFDYLQYPNEAKIAVETFDLVKETDKGYWIKNKPFGLKRWVSKNGLKRFAYPSEAEALKSYWFRKKRQMGILYRQLEIARRNFRTADKKMEEMGILPGITLFPHKEEILNGKMARLGNRSLSDL